MKEIKYRAWDIERKEMYTWEMLQDYDLKPWFSTNGIEVEMMQYTGLKDKYGKEIYEGDIVKCLELRNDTLNGYISEVFLEDGCWMVHEGEMCDDYLYLYDNTNPTKMPLTEIEVIGNIYENRDLIE